MSIQNFTPEAQAAIDMLYGKSETVAVAAEEASPIAQAVAAAAELLLSHHAGELDRKRLAAAMQLVLGNAVALNLDGSSSPCWLKRQAPARPLK